MAQRSRGYTIRYGGWMCGVSNYGEHSEPAFTGIHLCIDETHPGPPYRSGGPLFVTKKKFSLARSDDHYVFYHSILGWYRGHMGVTPYVPLSDPVPTSLSGWGAKGWNRTYPLHPIYQLGVSIGELKDLPGMLSQTKRGFQSIQRLDKAIASGVHTVRELLKRAKTLPKNTGNSYLYGAFGLAPMLQDLLFLLKMQEKLDKKLRWLRRHNGKSVRRKIELNTSEFSEDIPRSIAPVSSVFPPLATDLYGPGQTTNVSMPILKSYRRRIWFSAKWRIAIPEWYLKPRPDGGITPLSQTLLGLEPNASIIYKLMPWSWLLDWFTSVGDVMQNASAYAKYGVVAEYAYVMCRETFTYACPGRIVLHSGKLGPGFAWVDPDWSWSGVSKTEYQFRQREAANPYGFGITFGSLTGFQWSILVALGLSRGGKSSSPRT